MKEEQKINGLPKDWKIVDVNSIGRVETGSTPSKQNANYYADEFPFYKPTDLEAGYNVRIAKDNLSEAGIKQARFLPENSILVTCIGATIGKTGLIRKAGASNQQINAIIPSDNVHPSFVYYQIIGPEFQKRIKDNASATTLPILNKTKFQNLPFVIAPLAEQQQIVSKIEELFSELDKGIEELKAAQQQLKVYRQAVLKCAFEGKLTNKVVKDGELPEGWKWKQLKEIVSLLGDGLHGTPKYSEDGDYYFINGNNLLDGKIVLKESTKRVGYGEYQKHKKNLNETTILVSINGTLGNTAFYNGEKVILGKSACYFNLNAEGNKQYVRYILTSKRFLSYAAETATGSTIPNVSLKAMREFGIPLPPIQEQHQIVQEIESRLSVCDKTEETIIASLKQAGALRQNILKRAFEGKLL